METILTRIRKAPACSVSLESRVTRSRSAISAAKPKILSTIAESVQRSHPACGLPFPFFARCHAVHDVSSVYHRQAQTFTASNSRGQASRRDERHRAPHALWRQRPPQDRARQPRDPQRMLEALRRVRRAATQLESFSLNKTY